MQSVYVVPLSEFPVEIADFLESCSFFACQNDDSDQDYLEFDLEADLTDCTIPEEEAYYEVRRFLLAGLIKGTKRPDIVLIAQHK
jgi:hypothetical protein